MDNSLFRLLRSKYQYIANRKNRDRKTLVFRLIISYILIIFVCTAGIGLLSEKFVTKSIINNTIKSNNEILNQLKNTIDSYVLGNIDKISLMILQDTLDDTDIAYYFTNSAKGNLSGIMKVSKYLDYLKMANPLVSNISIYYKKNQLLISTDGVRHLSPEFKPDEALVKSVDKLCTVGSSVWVSTNNIPFQINMGTTVKDDLLFIRKAPLTVSSPEEGGFILISINEDVLNNIIKTSSPVDFGQILVFDEEGTIISHSNKEYLYSNIANQSYGKKAMELKESSNYFLTTLNNINSVISVASSDYNGWRYTSIKSIDTIGESYFFLRKTILIISSAIFTFALIISLVSARKVYSPIKSLTNSCREIIKNKSFTTTGNECEIIVSTLNILASQLSDQEKKLVTSFPVLKHHFIMSLVNGNILDLKEVNSRSELLKVSLPFEYYFTLLVKIDKLPSNIGLRTYEIAKLDIIDYIENICIPEDIKCLCTENNGELIAVYNSNTEYVILEDLAEQISKQIYSTLKVKSYLGVGRIVCGVKNLSHSHIDAQNCIKYSYIYPDRCLIKFSDTLQWELNNKRVPYQLLDGFSSSVKAHTKDAAISTMKNMLYKIQKEQLSYSSAMKLISKMISFMDGFMEQIEVNIYSASEEDIYSHFNSISNINELEAWLEETIEQVFLSIEAKRSSRNSELVNDVKTLIDKNYENPDFSLSFIASTLFISPNYLSRIFKEETGENFVNFLADYRLQKAKGLILSSDMKIEEISLKTGYSSPQYFIKKFKEKHGVTPREYRYKEGSINIRPI